MSQASSHFLRKSPFIFFEHVLQLLCLPDCFPKLPGNCGKPGPDDEPRAWQDSSMQYLALWLAAKNGLFKQFARLLSCKTPYVDNGRGIIPRPWSRKHTSTSRKHTYSIVEETYLDHVCRTKPFVIQFARRLSHKSLTSTMVLDYGRKTWPRLLVNKLTFNLDEGSEHNHT